MPNMPTFASCTEKAMMGGGYTRVVRVSVIGVGVVRGE